jgi:hypothetical protein
MRQSKCVNVIATAAKELFHVAGVASDASGIGAKRRSDKEMRKALVSSCAVAVAALGAAALSAEPLMIGGTATNPFGGSVRLAQAAQPATEPGKPPANEPGKKPPADDPNGQAAPAPPNGQAAPPDQSGQAAPPNQSGQAAASDPEDADGPGDDDDDRRGERDDDRNGVDDAN